MCVFGAAVCTIQARKHYIESLPVVPEIKKIASLKAVGACSLRICRPEVERLLDIRKSSTYLCKTAQAYYYVSRLQ